LEPQTPEQKKQQLQLTIVAFCWGSIGTAVVMSAVLGFGFLLTAVAALSVAAIAAGIAWSVLGSRR
jgi:hypothetical protein